MRRLGAAAAAAAVLVLVSGCGSQATAPTASPTVTVHAVTSAAPPASATPSASSSAPSASSSSTPSAAASSAAAPGPTPTSAAEGATPADQCPDDDIGVTVTDADGGGGAGSEQLLVLFTNTGGSTCVLRGTPAVSVVGGASGPRLGPAADRVQTGVKSLRLAVGGSVAAPLKIVDIGTGGGPLTGCRVVTGAGYRVSAPHSTRATFVKGAARACEDGPVFMTVSPVIRFAG